MRYVLYSLLLMQLVFSNADFTKNETSVFAQDKQQIEEIKNENIQTPINKIEYSAEDESNNSTKIQTNITTETTKDIETTNIKKNSDYITVEYIDDETKNQTENITNENSQDIINDEITDSQETAQEYIEEEIDYFVKVEHENFLTSKSIYLSYPNYPKNIYKNQRFEVKVKALVTKDNFDKIETRFLDAVNMTVLNPENKWQEKDSNVYENSYYFKSYAKKFVMPIFQVLLYKNDQLVEVEYLKPENINFTDIAKDDDKFSSIIASKLVIKAYKTKQYNNNELITILDIEANESNLEDFHLRYVQEQGFSKITDNYPEQKMLYYLVMPIHKKKIEFNYYNTLNKKFTTITIPIVLDNELISTQTDLNPNNSNILFYKKVALSILSLVLLGLYIWKRKYMYLLFLMISTIVLIIYMMPNRQAFIKNGTTIYILPTNNSTIFYKTTRTNVVEVAMKKENFVKIIMQENNKKIIGWVKEDKLVEN